MATFAVATTTAIAAPARRAKAANAHRAKARRGRSPRATRRTNRRTNNTRLQRVASRSATKNIRTDNPTKKPARWKGPFTTTAEIASFMKRRGLSDPRFQLVTQRQDSGTVRNVLQLPAQHLGAYAKEFSDKKNLMGVMLGRGKGWQHLVIRLGEKTYELYAQELTAKNKRFPKNGKEKWWMEKGKVYTSSIMMTERLIQLKPREMAGIKKLIKSIETEMKQNGGEIAFRGNCAALFFYSQVGSRGEYLSDLVGIDNGSNSDWAMDELHADGNSRVVATVLHLPKNKARVKHPGFQNLEGIKEVSTKYPKDARAVRVDR